MMIKHLKEDHFNCHLCPKENKFIFYKNYNSLKIHFQMSHYICPYPACIE